MPEAPVLRQSPAAKQAWARIDRREDSIFRHFPLLTGFLNERIPKAAHVVIVGGGRGLLATLLANWERTFSNADIAPIREPFVPTVQADMEEALPPIDRARLSGRQACVVTPFSLEYTDIDASLGNIAALLERGEQFVWLCHHSDSETVRDIRRLGELLEVARSAFERARERPNDRWFKLAHRVEQRLNLIYAGEGCLRIARTSEEEFARVSEALLRISDTRVGVAFSIVAVLRDNAAHPESRDEALELLRQIIKRLEIEMHIASLLLQRRFASHEDLQRFASHRFTLAEHACFPTGNKPKPVCIVGIFRKN